MRIKDYEIIISGVKDTIFSKALSDGENQFLHALGLCRLFRGSDALFLLDEPETHFNPDWRSKFITRIKECLSSGFIFDFDSFDSGSSGRHEMFITTHTPFLISDSTPEKVLVFRKEGESVQVTTPDYNTYGASINKITMKTFGKRETIGEQAVQTMNGLRARFQKGEDKDTLLQEINDTLGDSVEKMLLVKTILDSMREN